MPSSAAEVLVLALDLDGDPLARADNALGQILSIFTGAGGYDPQLVMDDKIVDGSIRQLVDVQATSLADANSRTATISARTAAAAGPRADR